jgi:cytochrome P450
MGVIPSLIGVRDRNDHIRRRRPWTRAFNTAAVKGYTPLLAKRLSQLLDVLSSQQQRAGQVDLAAYIDYFA